MGPQNTDGGEMSSPEWLRTAVRKIDHSHKLDVAAEQLAPMAEPLAGGSPGRVLRGQWLGHALHPMLTDFPLGCWLSASLLDCVGGRSSRPYARRLIAMGLVFSVPTAASGLADWSQVQQRDERVRRLGVVHAVGNTIVGAMYFRSWRARRRGHHVRGMGWSFLGGSLAVVTGWLGGHMAIGHGAASGERGLDAAGTRTDDGAQVSGPEEVLDLEEASRRLGVPAEQVQVMVADGVLVPLEATGAPRFRSADVDAVRLLGG